MNQTSVLLIIITTLIAMNDAIPPSVNIGVNVETHLCKQLKTLKLFA